VRVGPTDTVSAQAPIRWGRGCGHHDETGPNLQPKTDDRGSPNRQDLHRRLYSFREGNIVALCPELDLASQGKSVEEATDNLREAVELLLATADADEIASRLKARIYVTHFEVSVGAA